MNRAPITLMHCLSSPMTLQPTRQATTRSLRRHNRVRTMTSAWAAMQRPGPAKKGATSMPAVMSPSYRHLQALPRHCSWLWDCLVSVPSSAVATPAHMPPPQYDGDCSRPTSLIGRDDAGGDNASYWREAAPMLLTAPQPRQALAMSLGAVALVTRKTVT